jgi:hypothetical protein
MLSQKFKTIAIAMCCLFASIAMVTPSADGLFYCFPMERMMIDDCCSDDHSTQESPEFAPPQCCEKISLSSENVPPSPSVFTFDKEDIEPELNLYRHDAQVEIIAFTLSLLNTSARGPPHPPPLETPLYDLNCAYLI